MNEEKVGAMKKVVFIVAKLVEDPSAYECNTSADVEKEIQAEMPFIPDVARIEKVTVLDY